MEIEIIINGETIISIRDLKKICKKLPSRELIDLYHYMDNLSGIISDMYFRIPEIRERILANEKRQKAELQYLLNMHNFSETSKKKFKDIKFETDPL